VPAMAAWEVPPLCYAIDTVLKKLENHHNGVVSNGLTSFAIPILDTYVTLVYVSQLWPFHFPGITADPKIDHAVARCG
jgi:hypothetical protein